MPSIPAFCSHCGLLFDGRGGIHIENSYNIKIEGGSISCPRCHEDASLLSGTYYSHGNTLELVDGPPITRSIFAELDKLVRQAQAGQITTEQLASRAAEFHEGVGSAIALLVSRYPKTMIFVIMFLGMLKYAGLHTDLNQLVDQIAIYASSHPDGGSLEDAGGGHGQKPHGQERQKDRQGPEKGPADKGDRVFHPKPPSTRRRDVNKLRRDALRKRRSSFPRR